VICASCASSTVNPDHPEFLVYERIMQFPESWLRAFVNPDIDTEALSHRLTMAGLEVEETTPVAPPFRDVVVAHIVAVASHPNAKAARVPMEADRATEIVASCRSYRTTTNA